jgi:hypothetical protein
MGGQKQAHIKEQKQEVTKLQNNFPNGRPKASTHQRTEAGSD